MLKIVKCLKYVWIYKCKPVSPSLYVSSRIEYFKPLGYYWEKATIGESNE
ncbi:hypothetical protein [Streptococcus pyogenes]|nr:hypothetical protein [Streptococcus pyogenes]VGQ25070.1 phage protein [Streptococcus pyogenes]VGV24096.1 phage protein [Streptococcus pyogenes]VGV57411.1 phage protein [Streptococcus pyogenes]VGV80195.1 phage protein [Streptococcus pyogenes]VHA94999.1 phage protein [Streptococcus pyogenes]